MVTERLVISFTEVPSYDKGLVKYRNGCVQIQGAIRLMVSKQDLIQQFSNDEEG